MLEALITSWRRSLAAQNKSAATIKTYSAATEQMRTHLEAAGITAAPDVTRAHLESFVADLLENKSAATASNRYRAIQQFWKWATEEGEVDSDPMARMKPPIVPEQPAPILRDEQIKALLKVCSARTYNDVRDTAIIRLFLDTGMRLSELTGLRVDDVDLNYNVAAVMGKGRRRRECPFGSKTAVALDRYLRQRSRQKHIAGEDALWLGERGRGPLASNGIAQMLIRRGNAAGIDGLHPHLLRHTSAHNWRAAGGGEDEAMRLFGWKSRTMLTRYAASAADERAREAHKRLRLGDRF